MNWCVLIVIVLSLIAKPAQGEAIDAFWRETLDGLSREPMEAEVEKVEEALPHRKYRVTLRGLGGTRFRAWLAMPVHGEGPVKPWPVIVTAPGYSGRGTGVLLGECQRGYAILQVFPRGQGDSADLSPIEGDKLTGQLDQPEGAYYHGAYTDVIRGIDFVTTRDDIDSGRIALVGTSQGGGIALAVAALDPRVKAVVAHVPFLCDMRTAARTPGSLVKTLLDKAGRNDEAALRTLDYFDPLQLAPRVRVPVLLSAGGKDRLCPAETIHAVHERLSGEKRLEYYHNLTHTSCVAFYNLTWSWLDQHFRERATHE